MREERQKSLALLCVDYSSPPLSSAYATEVTVLTIGAATNPNITTIRARVTRRFIVDSLLHKDNTVSCETNIFSIIPYSSRYARYILS